MPLRILKIRRKMGAVPTEGIPDQIQNIPDALPALNAELQPQHSGSELPDFFLLHPQIQRLCIIYDIVTVSALILHRESVPQPVCEH